MKFKPPYWFHRNIKFEKEEVDKVAKELKHVSRELIVRDEPLLSSYHFKLHQRPDKIWNDRYSKIMEGVVKEIGMFTTTKYTYEYWTQLYFKNGGHPPHHHIDPEQKFYGCLSWVHFHRTPEEHYFTFLNSDGEIYSPKEQEDGDLIVFPSFIWHQIYPNKSDVERFVTAGNIAFTHIDFHTIGLKDYQK